MAKRKQNVRSKRKVKKHVEVGVVHIRSTFVILMADPCRSTGTT